MKFLVCFIIITIFLLQQSECSADAANTFYFDDNIFKELLNQIQHLNVKLDNYKKDFNKPVLPTSCAQAKADGIQLLALPQLEIKPFYAYCLHDPKNNGSAWTVIQRRQDNTTNFYRNWQDYEHGFGNVEQEFFIGLSKLHALTYTAKHELWIKLMDFNNETRHAYYNTFAIDDSESQYTLSVLGDFYGTAGDALRRHQGQKFTTRDNDNDASFNDNCAQYYKSGWWHEKCIDSNLNGQYYKGNYTNKWVNGVVWKTWPGYYHSLKYVHMAIRPVV